MQKMYSGQPYRTAMHRAMLQHTHTLENKLDVNTHHRSLDGYTHIHVHVSDHLM